MVPTALTIDDVLLPVVKSILDISKIKTFGGNYFTRWRDKIYDTLDVLNFAKYPT